MLETPSICFNNHVCSSASLFCSLPGLIRFRNHLLDLGVCPATLWYLRRPLKYVCFAFCISEMSLPCSVLEDFKRPRSVKWEVNGFLLVVSWLFTRHTPIRMGCLEEAMETTEHVESAQRRQRLQHAAGCSTSMPSTSLAHKTLDARVLGRKGPTSFTIHGELRHRTGSLLPLPGHDALYAQLYVYGPDSALQFAYAILNQLASTGRHLPAHLHYSSAKDRRRFNLPTTDEVAIVIPEDGSESSGMRDIILHLEGNNGLMRINECHPAYLPLHYVLLFPRGELGWEPDLKQWDVNRDQPSSE
ncbi:hypothetical protein RHGRI_014498 [Rhododendron griersonianum]|uniref:Uncharacterized protein n=1 Tax=Rhododendron griersonianum TaxID=479676 RepID=A0AAV6K9L6_9ERIC|nr:hypothetical protein RHGRI_014498 [Rhododendron griersonianum]